MRMTEAERKRYRRFLGTADDFREISAEEFSQRAQERKAEDEADLKQRQAKPDRKA